MPTKRFLPKSLFLAIEKVHKASNDDQLFALYKESGMLVILCVLCQRIVADTSLKLFLIYLEILCKNKYIFGPDSPIYSIHFNKFYSVTTIFLTISVNPSFLIFTK